MKRSSAIMAAALAASTDYINKNPKWASNRSRVTRHFANRIAPTIPVNSNQEQTRRLAQ